MLPEIGDFPQPCPASLLFLTGRPEALAEEPLRRDRPPSCSASPDRAWPCHAVRRTAAAGRRGMLGAPPAPRASGGHWRRRTAGAAG
jgi:hypothetical protein